MLIITIIIITIINFLSHGETKMEGEYNSVKRFGGIHSLLFDFMEKSKFFV